MNARPVRAFCCGFGAVKGRGLPVERGMLEGIRSGIGILTSLGVVLPVFAVVGLGFLGVYVWRRAGSSHSLMTRLWQLFHGKQECKDPVIGEFLDEQGALLQFRFTTGVRARTRQQAQALIRWTRENNEDMGHVAACGPYFDLEKIELKAEDQLPNVWLLLARFFAAIVFFTLSLTAAWGIAFWDDAVLQMKKSKVFFSINATSAKRFGVAEKLSLDQCSNEAAAPSTFSPEDREIVCKLLKSDELASYINETVKSQRLALAFLLLVLAFFCRELTVWFLQGVHSQEMFRRLRGRKRLEGPLALVEPGGNPPIHDSRHDGAVGTPTRN